MHSFGRVSVAILDWWKMWDESFVTRPRSSTAGCNMTTETQTTACMQAANCTEPSFRYNATFIDIPVARFSPGKVVHETQVVDAMRGLLENLKQQARTDLSIEDLKDSNEPDLK